MLKLLKWSAIIFLGIPLALGLLFGPLLGVEGATWAGTLVAWAVAGLVAWWWMSRRGKFRRKMSRFGITDQAGFVPGPGEYAVEVKGESHYQSNLAVICGPRKEDGENLAVRARLVPEPHNPADRNAVRVEIAGRQVGYLSRDAAAAWPGQTVECNGIIRGGWQRRNGETGHYGVRLDLPMG